MRSLLGGVVLCKYLVVMRSWLGVVAVVFVIVVAVIACVEFGMFLVMVFS